MNYCVPHFFFVYSTTTKSYLLLLFYFLFSSFVLSCFLSIIRFFASFLLVCTRLTMCVCATIDVVVYCHSICSQYQHRLQIVLYSSKSFSTFLTESSLVFFSVQTHLIHMFALSVRAESRIRLYYSHFNAYTHTHIHSFRSFTVPFHSVPFYFFSFFIFIFAHLPICPYTHKLL